MELSNLIILLWGFDILNIAGLVIISLVYTFNKKIPSKRILRVVDIMFYLCILTPLVILLLNMLNGG